SLGLPLSTHGSIPSRAPLVTPQAALRFPDYHTLSKIFSIVKPRLLPGGSIGCCNSIAIFKASLHFSTWCEATHGIRSDQCTMGECVKCMRPCGVCPGSFIGLEAT